MITHSLKIKSVKTDTVDGIRDVVVSVSWELSATDGTSTVVLQGASLMNKPSENFTQFQQLTEEQVIAWVTEDSVIEAHKRSLEQQLPKQQSPSTEQSPALPWA